MTWCKGVESGHRYAHGENTMWRQRSTSCAMPRVSGRPPEARREVWNRFFLIALWRNHLCWRISSLHNCEVMHLYHLNDTVCGSPSKGIQPITAKCIVRWQWHHSLPELRLSLAFRGPFPVTRLWRKVCRNEGGLPYPVCPHLNSSQLQLCFFK